VIPLYGVFMETLGRKFAMNTACSIYAIGAVVCTTSTSMYTLIGARALAGVR
jgi:MFS family permease